jgi:hypothetical protein
VHFSSFFLRSHPAMLYAQHPANANPYYQQLRGLLPGGEAIQ